MSDDSLSAYRKRIDSIYSDMRWDLKGAVFMGRILDLDDPKQVAVALWYLLDVNATKRLMPDDRQ